MECSDEKVNGITERDVKFKGLSGQGSFFYKTVSLFTICIPVLEVRHFTSCGNENKSCMRVDES